MQPVQDLTVERPRQPDAVPIQPRGCRAPRNLQTWVPRFVARLQALPDLRDVASDQQNVGLAGARATIDRNTASAPGHHAAGARRRRSTTRSASGRSRRCSRSSISTASCSKPAPSLADEPDALAARSSCRSADRRVEVTAAALSHGWRRRRRPSPMNHQGQFPVVTVSFNLAPGASLGDAIKAVEGAKTDLGLPASIQTGFQGTALAFQASLANEPLADSRRARHRLHRAWACCTRATSIRSRSCPTLPSAGVGALAGADLFAALSSASSRSSASFCSSAS